MSIGTMIAYLFGSRAAIEHIAADPWALWVGLAMTVSAGLARSYASRDLSRQPWHLVLPAAVALTLAGLLSFVITTPVNQPGNGPAFPVGYRSLASLILLTAPLAWLYAIPYERYLPWSRAVRARLITLAIVATWRVVLMIRVIAVLLDDRVVASACLVLLVADVGMLVGLAVTGVQSNGRTDRQTPTLAGAMSGIPAETIPKGERNTVGNVTCSLALVGVIAFPILFFMIGKLPFPATNWNRLLAEGGGPAPALSAWLLVGTVPAFFFAILPWTQRRPRLQTRIDRLFARNQVAEALAILAAHEPTDLPPGWSLPPEESYRDPPVLLDIIDVISSNTFTGWFREVYLDRFRAYLKLPLWYWYYDEDLDKMVRILDRLPDGPALARQLLDAARTFEATHPHVQAMLLFPEPTPSGRREEILAAIERRAAGESGLSLA